MPAASLSKGGRNPACEISYTISGKISDTTVWYHVRYRLRYRYMPRITCLNCCMNRNAWWWRSRTGLRKLIHSPGEFLLGHVQIIRHTLKKAGVGSKVRRRRRLNGRKFKLVQIVTPTAIAVRIIAIVTVVMVLGRSTWRNRKLSVPRSN